MKTLLALLITLIVSVVIIYKMDTVQHGKSLGKQAATTYCNMIKLQRVAAPNTKFNREIEQLQLKHSSLMQRCYKLDDIERAEFTKTYTSIVGYCN